MNHSPPLNQDIREHLAKHLHELTQIGLALSVEKDINRLLRMILTEARALSRAEAGTLYVVDKDEKRLRFAVMQNDAMKERLADELGEDRSLPDVLLYKKASPNFNNVSSYVALTGEIVNIPDVYQADGFDFSGTRQYDAATGYRSQSMLVIPMKNHENEIIGVLQLLNARHPDTGHVDRFSTEYEDVIASLASQAAVSLTNTQLIQELKELLYAFIQSIATAIDAKSPYTGGHIKRVVDLTMIIAEKINEVDRGPFRDVRFTDEQMEELRLAAWMHDVGKITTPEYVVDKASKLQTIFDRIDLVETRFHLIAQSIENSYLRRQLALLRKEGEKDNENAAPVQQLDRACRDEIAELYHHLAFLKALNKTGRPITSEETTRVLALAENAYQLNGMRFPYLTEDEVKNLSIRQGTLTDEERGIIENHVVMTVKLLEQLPFPRRLANMPTYAGSHHEKLDGSGYPRKLSGDALPLQAKILAVADIFEALTAKDRPYKPPMKLSQALKILGDMKEKGHIDPDIYDLFVQDRLYATYGAMALTSEQMDVSD